MRPTIKDLAKAAGVSLATVDRVLNERPNVSSKTVARVQEAIDRIGYVRNLAAVNLVRNKVYHFQFILPDTGDQFLDVIAREVAEASKALNDDFVAADVVRLPIEDGHRVADYLTSLTPETVSGVAIMAPESPQVRDAVARLRERGITAVNFLSGRSAYGQTDFVGIDNRAAGATAARLIGRFSCRIQGRVLVIAETMRARDSIERRLGFDDVLNNEFSNLLALPSLETHAEPARTRRIIERTLAHYHDIAAVYIMSSEARVPLSVLCEMCKPGKLVCLAHERTQFTVAALKAGQLDAVIAQNAGHAVRSAIRIMQAKIAHRASVTSQDSLRIEILLRDNL